MPASCIRPAPEVSPEQMRLIGRVANLDTQDRMIFLVDPAQLLDQIEADVLSKSSIECPERPSKAFVIRLLIADDSALMRKLLEGIFREEGDFDIRLARNGTEALELVRSFDPQVVTLDVQMPGMDGLACLGQIMIEAPRPVVMISALTDEGAEATLEAIELGAVDFVAKPSGTVSLEIDRLRPILVEKGPCAPPTPEFRRTLRLKERIRHQFRGAGVLHVGLPRSTKPRAPGTGKPDSSPGLVLIGTSTGGPAALDVVLPQLPPAVSLAGAGRAAYAGELHRSRSPSGSIGICELRVVEVNRPMLLQAGTIYIGRGDADLIVARGRSSGITCDAGAGPTRLSLAPQRREDGDSAMENFMSRRA